MQFEIKFTSDYAAKVYNGKLIYGSADAAAFDLRASIETVLTIMPGEQAMVPTGIAMQAVTSTDYMSELFLPDHLRFAGLVLPRSGRGSRDGLVLGNTVGLIDQDYAGEIQLCVWARPTDGSVVGNRLASEKVTIEPGERIAQLMIVPVYRPAFTIVSEFGKATKRGAGGFGSTGK